MFQISTSGFYNRFQILNIGYASLQKGRWDWKDIISPFSRLYYVDKGSASVIMPDGERPLTPGHLYLIPEFTKHSYICGESFGHFYIHFSRENVFRPGTIRNMTLPFEVEAKPMDVEAVKELLRIIPARSLVEIDPNKYEKPSVTLNQKTKRMKTHLCLYFKKCAAWDCSCNLVHALWKRGRWSMKSTTHVS